VNLAQVQDEKVASGFKETNMATILIIDDERLICELMQAVFCGRGHEVLTAVSGRQGVEMFRREKPRFTLLDLHMPEMNGIETLKQIRAIDPNACVIVLTGGGNDALESQARGLGVTDFLGKGVSLDVLLWVMERIPLHAATLWFMERIPLHAATPPARVRAQTATVETLGESRELESILVVDDEPQVRALISQFFLKRGYRVRTAQDGPTALALTAKDPPQFIITDMQMPGMNGLELLRELRVRQYAGGFIALTACEDDNLLKEALDLGAVDVMGKPVDLERLELAVQLGCILTAL
jgi:CheY-like chemotaxis protein